MNAKDQDVVNHKLNLNYKTDNGIWLHKGKTLRKIVGTAGMLLPIVLLAVSLTFFELSGPLESISHYYYTRATPLFIGIVSLIGIFLIVYSGEDRYEYWRALVHYISAALFLMALAFMSLFLFVKSNIPKGKRSPEKIKRNRVYRVCGIIMLLALCVIFLGLLNIIPRESYDRLNLTFWMEALAVECFGFSWLVKGEALMQDK